ncbi:MAG: hypothetical protein N2036_10585 [Bryobacteraceae bacterium]|nr:hypothetical protein [Bryobacteraceae bacterium]MCX7604507.1 hypothetical protein [Bryobacteraceae bacterium]
MRQDESFFEGQELILLYIAKRLREAKAVEELLTQAGIDYLVEADLYMGGFLFRRALHGAFFYVTSAADARARELMRAHGYRPYEPDDIG